MKGDLYKEHLDTLVSTSNEYRLHTHISDVRFGVNSPLCMNSSQDKALEGYQKVVTFFEGSGLLEEELEIDVCLCVRMYMS